MSSSEEGKTQSRSKSEEQPQVNKSSVDEKSREGDSKSEEQTTKDDKNEQTIEKIEKQPKTTTASKKTSLKSGNYEESRTNLIINYLPPGMTEGGLATLFSPYGVLKNCKIVMDFNTQKSRGYGFVEYDSPQNADRARTSLNGYSIQGKKLKVAFARPHCKEIMNSNLYITGLSIDFETRDLQQLFKPYGKLIECRVLKDKKGKSRNVGFVRLGTHANAVRAVNDLDSKPLTSGGKPIRVKLATNRAAPSSRGGSRRGGGGRGGGGRGRGTSSTSNRNSRGGTTSGGGRKGQRNTSGQKGIGPGGTSSSGSFPTLTPFEFPTQPFEESTIYGQAAPPSYPPYGFGYNPYTTRNPFFDPYAAPPFGYSTTGRYPPFESSFPFYPGNISGLGNISDIPGVRGSLQQGGKTSSKKTNRSKKGEKGQKGTSLSVGNGLIPDISTAAIGLPMTGIGVVPPTATSAQGTASKSGPFTVMVYDLPAYFNEDHLIQHFAKFGPITDVKVWRDNDHLAKGVGEISYFYYQDAQRAVTKMDDRRLGVRNVRVRHSDTKK